jgi:hypothetical protein
MRPNSRSALGFLSAAATLIAAMPPSSFSAGQDGRPGSAPAYGGQGGRSSAGSA